MANKTRDQLMGSAAGAVPAKPTIPSGRLTHPVVTNETVLAKPPEGAEVFNGPTLFASGVTFVADDNSMSLYLLQSNHYFDDKGAAHPVNQIFARVVFPSAIAPALEEALKGYVKHLETNAPATAKQA